MVPLLSISCVASFWCRRQLGWSAIWFSSSRPSLLAEIFFLRMALCAHTKTKSCVFLLRLTAHVGKAPFLGQLVQMAVRPRSFELCMPLGCLGAVRSQDPKLLQSSQWLQGMLMKHWPRILLSQHFFIARIRVFFVGLFVVVLLLS